MRSSPSPNRTSPVRPNPTTAARHSLAVTAAVATVLALNPGAAVAGTSDDDPQPGVGLQTIDDLGGLPDASTIAQAVHELEAEEPVRYELEGFVSTVEVVHTQDEDVVVTLASDLLFEVDSAVLPEQAQQRVAELATQVPAGATVAVDGHTDSVASDAYNQTLSEQRAQAVAAVVSASRPDLQLEVRGHGESSPVAAESGDDVAAARAQNRRVELRYTAQGATTTDAATSQPTPEVAPYTAGEARVDAVDADDLVAEQVLEVPAGDGAGAQVRVGVEAVTVRGPVARVRLQLTPLEPPAGEDDAISVLSMTGDGELYLQVIDTEHLTTYTTLREVVSTWATHTIFAETALDRTLRYEAYVPRPLDDVDSVDVSVLPQWPRFEDVPVVWDR